LEAGRSVRMRFRLNRTTIWAETTGRIAWTSQERKLAGIELCDLPDTAREVLSGLLRETSWRHASDQGVDTLAGFRKLPSSPLERRRYLRQRITAYVKLDEDNGGVIVDASETGLRVRAFRELETGSSVRMRYDLNRTTFWVEAKGRIVWTSPTREFAGIEFSDRPNAAREVIRGLLREASWRLVSNRSIDTTEPNATNRTSVIATTHSEVMGTDSTSTRPFDSGTAFLSKPRVPELTRQTGPPAGILATISREIATPSTRTTAVVLVILFCVLVLALIGVFRPDMLSIQRETESSVSSMNPTPSPSLPSPSPRDLPGTVLQIAVKHVDDANALVESLKKNNFPAFVFRRSGAHFYKVFVGPYGDPGSVGIVKEKLTMQGIKAIEIRWLP
jgi:PilZ domain/SPOR domain